MAFPSPSLTTPSLGDWQFSFGGYTFGSAQAVKVKQVTGLGDLAAVRTADVSRTRDHGQIIGLDVYGGRDITFDLEAERSDGTVQATLSDLAEATPVGLTTEQPLWFKIPGFDTTLCVMCRVRKRTLPWDVGYQIGNVGVVSMQFHATDPRVYTPGQSATVGLPAPVAGLTFPVTFPVTFGAVTPSGVTVTNPGNMETRPVLVLTGPVTNPSVQNASLDGTPILSLSNPDQVTFTVADGDQIVADLDMHTVLYYTGGVASGSAGAPRGNWVVPGSTWWNLPAGDNLIQFLSDDSSSVAGTCEIQWAGAYQL